MLVVHFFHCDIYTDHLHIFVWMTTEFQVRHSTFRYFYVLPFFNTKKKREKIYHAFIFCQSIINFYHVFSLLVSICRRWWINLFKLFLNERTYENQKTKQWQIAKQQSIFQKYFNRILFAFFKCQLNISLDCDPEK